MRWSYDYVMRGQRFERVFENRPRQVWAVAVEGNGASLVTFGEVREDRSQACGKTFTFLRNDARFTSCQLCQIVYVRLRAHDGNFHIAQRARQRQRVFQKTAIEINDGRRERLGG